MMNLYSLSIDLILKILSRLPAKSVARFLCVSKLWTSSILGNTPYFNELFRIMSSTMPRLLFAIEEDGVWSFFSIPQLPNPYGKSLLAAEFHAKLSPGDLRIDPFFKYNNDLRYFTCAYASGLIYFQGNRYDARSHLVCNPNTGLYVPLPYRVSYRKAYSLFGFEPIGKQYKVLFMAFPTGPDNHKILTLGTDTRRWRKLKCPFRHYIKSEGVCINGVLYYLGDREDYSTLKPDKFIVCFDLRSEKFTFIHDVERFCRLIDYKGKLALIFWEDDVDIDPDIIYSDDDVEDDDVDIYSREADDTIIELHVWVQEDVEKQEWSKYVYTCSDDKFFRHRHVFATGVTPWGEIVFTMRKHTFGQPFYVFYFNPEKNTLRRVEIQGGFGDTFKKPRCIRTFVNHIEDLNVNDLKILKSVHAPIKRKRRR